MRRGFFSGLFAFYHMANRTIKLHHSIPRASEEILVLLPIGTYANQAIQKAKIGQTVEFSTDWMREKMVLSRKTRFRINTTEFSFLIRHIYGEQMTIGKLFEQWEAWSVVEGYGKDGFSRDECLLLGCNRILQDE